EAAAIIGAARIILAAPVAGAVEAAPGEAMAGIKVPAQRGPETAAAIAPVMPAAMRPELTPAAKVAIVEGPGEPASVIEDVAIIERQVVVIVRAAVNRVAIAIGRIERGIRISLIISIGIAIAGLRLIGRRAIGGIAIIALVIRLRARRTGQRAKRSEGDEGRFEGVSHLRFAPDPPPREDSQGECQIDVHGLNPG